MRLGIFDYANDGRRSGVEYYALGLIRCLAPRLGPGDLVVYTNDPDVVRRVHPRVVVRVIPGRSRPALRLLWQHVWLPRQAEADGLDVLHCPAYVMPFLRCRVPCVVTVHDTHALDQPQWCSWRNRLHYALALPRSLRNAAQVIAVSEDTRDAILRRFGPLRHDVRAISPGIDAIFRDERDLAAEERCRRTYRLPDRYVVHVGNIEPRKNVRAALAAMRCLRDRGIDRTLILVGQFRREPRWLRRMISDAEAQGVVRQLGYVPRTDLSGLYRMAEAFLCVSRHEGFGFPALEAMACGTPVVSSLAGAMAQTLGNAAVSVNVEDVSSVADALAAVLSDASLRYKMSRAGLRQSRRFRWENTLDDLLDTYQAACVQRRGRTRSR